MCSLAIVRNPYTRMVSIYGYNRFGANESFPTFVRRWRKLMRPYMERGEKEEWYTPCHLLPMFEYTHSNGKQLVQSVVKQEELKLLKTKEGAKEAMKMDSTVSDLPDLVRDALLGMPHTVSDITIILSKTCLDPSSIYPLPPNRMLGKLLKSGTTTTTKKRWI